MKRIVIVITVFLLFSLAACDWLHRAGPGTRQPPHSSRRMKYPQVFTNGTRYYKVKAGDTLYSIASRAGLDYKQVAKWNQIKPPFTIFSGQNIILKTPYISEKERNVLPYKQEKTPANKTTKKKLKIIWQWPLQGRIEKTFAPPDQKGIDIVANKRHSISAAASGKVVYSGSGLIGYGNLVIIKHNKHFLSAYGNNSRLLVKEGSIVKRGQPIAEISSSGGRQAVLHFEIRKDGKPMNPQYFLPVP